MKLLIGSKKLVYLATTTFVVGTFAFAAGSKNVEDELQSVKGDEKATEVNALKTELLVSKTESEAMKQLDRLLSRYRGTGMEPGLWLRKAELYVRQSKTERFFEISRDSETVVKLAPQKVKAASSKKYLNQAVETYEMIARRFTHYEELDVVMFNNAFTRQQLNQDKQAESLYRDLLKRYPESILIPDTHLALGEMLFERKAFQQALAEFEAIKKYPESRVYPYGIYKAAWAKYNLRDTASGLKDLEAVVAFGKRVETEGLDAKLDLRNEALTDMVLFFEDVGNSASAFSYFKNQAGELLVGGLILKLSTLYVRHSKHADHERVLADFIKKLPESPEIPLAYKSLVENYEMQRNRPSALKSIVALDEVCEPKSSWSKANLNSNSKEAGLCVDTITKLSLVHANKWHRMWKKNQKYPEFADVAEAAYSIYLKYDKSSDLSLENRFAYAELLFQRNKFRDSSVQYAIVAKESKDVKLYHDAGYASIVSLEKAVNDKWSDADEKSFRVLSEVYLTRNKDGKYATDIRFKRAFIAYEKGRYKEAAPDFKDLGWNKRDTAFGEKSQNLYLDILNIQKEYALLREYTSKLLGTKLVDSREKQIRKIYEEASFSEAQKLQESGDFFEAADAFEKFALTNKQSILADKAWWNAIELYTKEGYIIKSTDMSRQMSKIFPQSTHSKDALLRSAQGFESMLELKKAADALVDLSRMDKAQEIKWRSLAADFYALSGFREEAVQIYRSMTKSKDQSISQGAYTKLTLLDETNKKTSDMRLVNEIAQSGLQPQASVAQAKIAEKAFNEGNLAEAFRLASKVLEMNKQGASKSALARGRTVQAKILQKEFVAQSVKSRGDRLAAVLQIKTEKLDKTTQAFQDVIRFGDAKTSVGALRSMAACYGHYVDSVRGLELVGEYTKEELAALKKELENLSLPMEDKRVDTLQDALKLAKRLELRDGSISEIQSELNSLNMKRTLSNAVQIKLPDIMLPKFNVMVPSIGGASL